MTHPILADMAASAGDPRDMTAQQIPKLRAALLGDLFTFAQVVFDFRDLNPVLHTDMCKLIMAWGTGDLRRLMLQVPRGHLKTSLCTIAHPLWRICGDPDAPIAIFNEKEDNAAMWVRTIRNVIQSSIIFQVLFEELLPPGISPRDRAVGKTLPRWWKWTDTELELQRSRHRPEPCIQALGVGSAAAGRHWPFVILDDLISEDAKNSPSLMAKAREFVDNMFQLGDPPIESNFLFACTPWSYDDCYAYALRNYNFKLFRRPCFDEAGTPIYPEKFNRDSLLAMYRARPMVFQAQYLCQPRPGEEQSFSFEWLRFGTVRGDTFEIEARFFDEAINPADVPDKPTQRVHLATMEKTILLDPIPGEANEARREPGCRHGLVVVGIDYWGRRYVLDAWAERVAPPDVIAMLFQKMRQWGTHRVGIEAVAFSVVYRSWLVEEARRRGEHVTCIDLEPGRRTKDSRITAKITPFRAGHYYIARDAETLFSSEYLEYPYGRTRDLMDALAYDDEPGVLPRPMSPVEAERYERAAEEWAADAGRDAITGY